MERTEIIKALECCTSADKNKTTDCPLSCPFGDIGCCEQSLMYHALSLIKELTEELEVTLKQYTTYQEAATQRMRELTEENERLRESNAGFALAHLFDTSPNGDCWSDVILQAKADTVRKMQTEIEKRCIKGGIYPAFVKSTIDQIAKEIIGGSYGKKD